MSDTRESSPSLVPRPSSLITDHLRGTRVRLTALSEADVPTIAGWQTDGAFLRLFDAVPAAPRNVAQLTTWLTGSQQRTDGFLFAIRPVNAEDLLGYIELDGILWSSGSAFFSIAIGDPAQRGQGFGSEAVELVMRFAFDELNMHRLQLTVFSY